MSIKQESLDFNIFSIKPTEFEEGKRDPFGFDDFSEKLSDKYLPFSGVVRKPIYFFFAEYVNWLLKNDKLHYKKKKEVELRLEKLLVCSWENKEGNLRGKNIIGAKQKHINPFKGNDGNWVERTCFEIYGASANKLITDKNIFIEKYIKDNCKEEMLLNEFLKKEGVFDKRNESILIATLRKFSQRKHSIFNGNHQLTQKYKNLFIRYLKESIRGINKIYYDDIKNFFIPKRNLEDGIYRKILDNDKKYPFMALNNWFSAFVIAVNNDINNKDSKKYWDSADKFFDKLNKHWDVNLKKRPEPKCWFDRNGDRYIKKEDNDFDEDGWNAVAWRAEGKYFYDFRHKALISLLKELY